MTSRIAHAGAIRLALHGLGVTDDGRDVVTVPRGKLGAYSPDLIDDWVRDTIPHVSISKSWPGVQITGGS